MVHLPLLLCGALTLQSLVTPSTVIEKDGQTIEFAVHGVVNFKSLTGLFSYIDAQTHRWPLPPGQREALRRRLLRGGVESRVISMVDARPLEVLTTHTAGELRRTLANVKEPLPPGYAAAFLAVQERWKHSLNAWSAAPSIEARVLSNWYPIEEGITLHGAAYDSVEHFWQAMKFHPALTAGELRESLDWLERGDFSAWLARMDGDPKLYIPNAYSIEFLRYNLTPARRRWFREELARQSLADGDNVRQSQQRPSRFTPYEEKVLWGDLADVFHLLYTLSAKDEPLRAELARRHFDAIYLDGHALPFVSEQVRALMLDAWRVKYAMPRFNEVIRSVPRSIRLAHFLNDADSPDIPLPVYIRYLNQIREHKIEHNSP